MYQRVCKGCGKKFETSNRRIFYCSDCIPDRGDRKQVARRYYLTRKAKNPEKEREYRERARKKLLEKVHAYREQFLLRVSPNRECQACGSKEELELHHRFYNDSDEKALIKRGGYSMTLKMMMKVFDNPERFRVLCRNCHKTLHMLLRQNSEVAYRLYQLSQEERG
jgi:hypothetical protein